MNSIRQIQDLNKRELENGVSPDASWHTDYRDTAYIYIGGLSFDLSEGDIVTIFSQFGEPTYINLIRDKDTGKSKGFAFLKYEDQRSTDLAVDNLGGTTIMGRMLRVDHTRYKKKDDDTDGGLELGDNARAIDDDLSNQQTENGSDVERERPMIREERELAALIQDHDEDDPMKAFLIQEKKDEVSKALAKVKDKASSGREHKKKDRHHRSHHASRIDDREPRRDRSHRDSETHRRRSRSGERPGHKSQNRERRDHSKRDEQERRRSSSRDRPTRGDDDLSERKRSRHRSRNHD